MNHLLFIDAVKPGELILVLTLLVFIPFFVGYKWGFYKGKDAARKEDIKK
jgi:hypothetical protein